MISKKLTYIAFCAMAGLASCSQDGTDEPLRPDAPEGIYFRSYLPTVVESRARVLTQTNFNACQVTAFNIDDPDLINGEGVLDPYFLDVCYSKVADGRFLPAPGNNCYWPDNNSHLHFFAYYPSVDSMRQTAPDGYFNLRNLTRLVDGNPAFDFKIMNFRVSPEIADQVDFMTAYAASALADGGHAGVDLNFKHNLARVEISAWGANEKYDFEIAGVRIGNPVVEGNFNLSSLIQGGSVNPWENTSGVHSRVQHIFGPGETLVLLSKDADSHAIDTDAASLMGSAGAAMVIPMNERIEMWEGKNDPAIDVTPYYTEKMYFSVLLRVKNKDGQVAYPYPNDRDGMEVVYLTVDSDREVTGRVYKSGDLYYTAPVEEDVEELRYTPSDTEEICAFGWAALPVAAKWEAGKIYSYNLNYSTGIGWHDPSDPTPGEPIIERASIPFSVNVEEWTPADDYNPDITVPKR